MAHAAKVKKQVLGQFFTVGDEWHDHLVDDFIAGYQRIVDPFAGGGDLIKSFSNASGYDVDPTLGWPVNDSLKAIPVGLRGDVCITNPPYSGKSSSTRRGFTDQSRYFDAHPDCNDLYKIGIKNCLDSFGRVVAIVPESFIMSGKLQDRLVFVNIIEARMFHDTECPVVVAGWDREVTDDFTIFKNSVRVGQRSMIDYAMPTCTPVDKTIKVDPTGALGLIGTDSENGARIRFVDATEIREVSPADRSFARFCVPYCSRALIDECNAVLEDLRVCTGDVVLSPFKNNTKTEVRRRRLDFGTAAKIVAQALGNLAATPGDLCGSWLNRYMFGTRSKALMDARWAEMDGGRGPVVMNDIFAFKR